MSGGRPKGQTYPEMLSFRVTSAERIELGKLANKRKVPVSVLLRSLIAQAAAQRTTKGGASVATPTSAPVAK